MARDGETYVVIDGDDPRAPFVTDNLAEAVSKVAACGDDHYVFAVFVNGMVDTERTERILNAWDRMRF